MKKINWFFFFLALFPLILYVTTTFQLRAMPDTYDFGEYMQYFAFTPVSSAIEGALQAGFETSMPWASYYVSYLVLVVIIRIMYETLVFLPKLCLNIFEERLKK